MDESVYEQAQRAADAQVSDALAARGRQPQPAPLIIDGERVCLDCEAPIGAARLSAVPAAVRCLDCQQDDELRRRCG